MFGIFSIKSHFDKTKQAWLTAILIIFIGFVFGAFYSNAVTEKNFADYKTFLDEWTKNAPLSFDSPMTSVFSVSDITTLLLVFLWSFFLFGKPASGFFSFKSGFSLGFFVSFLIKVFGMKGFAAGMYILFNYLVFTVPCLAAVTAQSFVLNSCITSAVFGKSGSGRERDIKRLFFPFVIVLGIAAAVTLLGNYIGRFVTIKILKALF